MRRIVGAVLAAMFLVLVTACGTSGTSDNNSSGSDTKDNEQSSDAVDVEKWADDFCGNFDDWLNGVKESSANIGNDIQAGDMEGAQAALVELFQSAPDQTQELIDSLKEGGAPDIDDGQGLVDELVDRFEGFEQAAQDAKTKAEALDTTDPTAFSTDGDALISEFETEVTDVGNSFAEIDTKYPDQDLQTALSDACT